MRSRIRKIRWLRRLNRKALVGWFARSERGTALAELAIAVPVFVLLFAATAEFGRYFYEYTTLAKAARMGSRYLVTACVRNSEDGIAKNLVVYGNAGGSGEPILAGLTPGHVTITKRNSLGGIQTSGVPETVTVEITGYEHESLFNLGGLMHNEDFSLNIDVKPSITMRYLLTTPCVPGA